VDDPFYNPYLDVESAAYDEPLFARDLDGQLIRMTEATAADFEKKVTVSIDGRTKDIPKAVARRDAKGNILLDANGVPLPRATTIYDAATEIFGGGNNPIPILCHQEHMRPVAVCRVCVVQIYKPEKDGGLRRQRKLFPACQHPVAQGMVVHTINSQVDRAERGRATRTEGEFVREQVDTLVRLLAVGHLHPDTERDGKYHNELRALAERLGTPATAADGCPTIPGKSRNGGVDYSSRFIRVDHDSCILCDRCVRACSEVRDFRVIGRTGKGSGTRIGFDLDVPMGDSGCVTCGECMTSCPTGALTFQHRVFAESDPWKDEPVRPDPIAAVELTNHRLFRHLPLSYLKWVEGGVARRPCRAGDVLCREGDYGTCAYVIDDGEFEVRQNPDGARGHGRAPLVVPDDDAATALFGPVRAVRSLADEIVGEMGAMTNQRRNATLRARGNGEVLMVARNVLQVLRRYRAVREIIDRAYGNRALETFLDRGRLFQGLTPGQNATCVAALRDQARLVRAAPGQVIFRQGQFADDFFFIRLGFVHVWQNYHGGEITLDYQKPGDCFGEIGLLSLLPEEIAPYAAGLDRLPLEEQQGRKAALRELGKVLDGDVKKLIETLPTGAAGIGRRTANCTALDHVELVLIPKEAFLKLLIEHPDVCAVMARNALNHLVQNDAKRTRSSAADRASRLGTFVERKLYQGQKLLALDLERCTRCDECVNACADSHDGVTRFVREGLRFGRYLVTNACRSCHEPYCLDGCPVDAIHRGKDSLEIRIESHCTGCGLCASNCPYGSIRIVARKTKEEAPAAPERLKADVERQAKDCDLCAGSATGPKCVYACPHDAAFRLTGEELWEKVAPSEPAARKGLRFA
jgi:Fe-S-cluster-containing hydrogenase component 2/CRP-like cAMP-binding protein